MPSLSTLVSSGAITGVVAEVPALPVEVTGVDTVVVAPVPPVEAAVTGTVVAAVPVLPVDVTVADAAVTEVAAGADVLADAGAVALELAGAAVLVAAVLVAAVPVAAPPVAALTVLEASDPELLLASSPPPQAANSEKAQAPSRAR